MLEIQNLTANELPCPCKSGEKALRCCAPVILQDLALKEPEALMRSRYTAFATGNVDYLLATSTEQLKQNLSREELLQSCRESEFVHLEVLKATNTQVEFIASLIFNDELHYIHETSNFVMENGRFKYDTGVLQPIAPTKLKRNDACPCGSGKKYKKCHGN